MAIPWAPLEREKVDGILRQYPPNSCQCDVAADALIEIAKTYDAGARVLRIRPKGRARFIVPKISLKTPWYEHFTTEVVDHCVDSLTGTDGTPASLYLESHWKYPDHLDLEPR